MNYKLISKIFGVRVYVWGCSAWTDHKGHVTHKFTPAHFLVDLKDKAKTIRLVAQSFDNPDDFYQDDFTPRQIFLDLA